MTNEQIILAESFKLMESGILGGSGIFGKITDENGEEKEIEFPEEIHTFRGWKERGFAVRKGEKAVAKFHIWKHSAKTTQNEETGEEETTENIFLKNSAWFTPKQVEPLKNREEKPDAPEAEAEQQTKNEQSAKTPKQEAETEENETTHAKRFQINEDLARRAKENRSFFDYVPGTASAEYERLVAEAEQVAARQKDRVPVDYHGKIDSLLDAYSKKIADYLNKENEISCRCPSVMIAGPANFPVRKKEKQVAAWDRNHEEYKKAEAILDKIRGVGRGGIASDDPNAIEKLTAKKAELERLQQHMKEANAEFRRTHTKEECKKSCAYPDWALSNNNAEIHRLQRRIEDLQKVKETPFENWNFQGGQVVANQNLCRLQVLFAEKPSESTRQSLKENGFRWSPKEKAWQRLLNQNAIHAAKRILPE